MEDLHQNDEYADKDNHSILANLPTDHFDRILHVSVSLAQLLRDNAFFVFPDRSVTTKFQYDYLFSLSKEQQITAIIEFFESATLGVEYIEPLVELTATIKDNEIKDKIDTSRYIPNCTKRKISVSRTFEIFAYIAIITQLFHSCPDIKTEFALDLDSESHFLSLFAKYPLYEKINTIIKACPNCTTQLHNFYTKLITHIYDKKELNNRWNVYFSRFTEMPTEIEIDFNGATDTTNEPNE